MMIFVTTQHICKYRRHFRNMRGNSSTGNISNMRRPPNILRPPNIRRQPDIRRLPNIRRTPNIRRPPNTPVLNSKNKKLLTKSNHYMLLNYVLKKVSTVFVSRVVVSTSEQMVSEHALLSAMSSYVSLHRSNQ